MNIFNMNLFNKIKSMSQNNMIVSVLLLGYIAFNNIKPPIPLAIFIDENVLAQVLLYLLGLLIVIYHNSVVGVIALFAIHEMILRSKVSTNGQAVYKYLPSEDKKNKNLNALNQFSVTLEEQVVATMAPLVLDGPSGPASFVPVLDKSDSSLLSDVDNQVLLN